MADVRARRIRESAEKVITAVRAGEHKALYKGAQLTDLEVTAQIASLNVEFMLGDTVAETPEGGFTAVCFKVGAVTKLRVYRHNHDGWLYVTFELRLAHERSGTKYTTFLSWYFYLVY